MDVKKVAKSVNDGIGTYKWLAGAGVVAVSVLVKLFAGLRQRSVPRSSK